METKIIVILVVLSVIIVACSMVLIISRKKEKPTIISDSIYGLFDSNNIIGIEFVRNKLVVSFKDSSEFNVNKLKEFGGKGISVIGDKMKFFISENRQENEKLFKDLLMKIER